MLASIWKTTEALVLSIALILGVASWFGADRVAERYFDKEEREHGRKRVRTIAAAVVAFAFLFSGLYATDAMKQSVQAQQNAENAAGICKDLGGTYCPKP